MGNTGLNEEETYSDVLMPVEEELVVGRKSGFAFWVDRAHNDRKVLVAIRGESATRNDYYDGPFDNWPTTTWTKPTSPITW